MTIFEKLSLTAINPPAAAGLEWLSIENEDTFSSINPNDGTVLAHAAYANEKLYETVIKKAHQTHLSWRNVPAPLRGEFIRQVGEALRKNKDALGSLVSLEMGKSKVEGDGEVQEMIDIADYAVGLSRMLYGKTMPSERPLHRIQEQWHPLGVVGVITAFNFPVAVWAWNAFIAAVCGNTVVWKPSHKVPLCCIAVHHICCEVMKSMGYDGVFSYYLPNRESRDLMLHDKRIPLVSFTGSTQVGRHVAATVGQRLGKTILELGGNNALIVDESAQVDLAIPAIVFGSIGTAGQRCTSTRRVIIHESLYDHVMTRLVKIYASILIGHSLDPSNLMGPLIDAQAVNLYEATIARIKQQGGKILYGGKKLPTEGYFVEPTLVEAENHHTFVQEETFVPILYLMRFKTIEEAIALQNHSDYGLSSAIFTQNFQRAELFLSPAGSDCGLANVNIGTSGAEIGGAFGGEKDTGGGRESGSDSWKAYMRRQTSTVNWGNHLPLAQGIHFAC
jgi:aldehyde dehydrogenase (NAD+)